MKKETHLCFLFCLFETLRVGSGAAGHLIHRGAVPLPLKGKDNRALQIKARLALAGARLYAPPVSAATLRSPQDGSVAPDIGSQTPLRPRYCPSPRGEGGPLRGG